jgi:hypothetical protein
MGSKVYSVKRQEELSNATAFKYGADTFYNLLELLSCDMWADDTSFPNRFECPVEDYETALNALKEHRNLYPNSSSLEWIRADNFESPLFDLLNDEYYTEDEAIGEFDSIMEQLGGIDRVIKCMENLYEERDQREGVTHIRFVVCD